MSRRKKNPSRITWSIAQELPINELFNLIDSGEKRYSISIGDVNYSGSLISTRLQCIRGNHKCVSCGIEGTIARLERQSQDVTGNGYHFNVYAKVTDCNYPLGYRYVTMTQDHILPHSLGGPTTLDNLQTMCTTCNNNKDSSIDFSNLPEINENVRNHLWESLIKNNNMAKVFVYFMVSPEFNINREAVKSLGVINFHNIKNQTELLKKVFIT